VSTEIVVPLFYHVDGLRGPCNFISTKPHGITTQNTLIVLLIAARAPNLAGIKNTHLSLRFLKHKNIKKPRPTEGGNLHCFVHLLLQNRRAPGGGQHKVLSPRQASQLVYASTVSFRRRSADRGATNIFSIVPE